MNQGHAKEAGTTLEPQTLAEAAAEAMWARDHACHALGIRIEQVGPGRARLSMQVRPDMANGHQICHGGLIFALADTAFAYACNSHNQNTVASACNIDFLAPAKVGDVLLAEAVERTVIGRSGVYDVEVCNQADKTIAHFRGKSRQIGEVLVDVD